MPDVDIRWRPSGGRGEYEHVPQEVLLERRILVDPLSVPGAMITTDAWGRIRDGKPRLRRDNPNDRAVLNVPNLIAALALLPDPRREDQGDLVLPLRDKGYVISAIRFNASLSGAGLAFCRPQRLRILHDSDEIDLVARLMGIATFLNRPDLPVAVRDLCDRYKQLVRSGHPSAELREVADRLINWLERHPLEAEAIEAPSDNFEENLEEKDGSAERNFDLANITADETKRRLVTHRRIERKQRIRIAKVVLFKRDHGTVFCENCTFDFERKYGKHGKGYIEVHHLLPLAAILPNTITKLGDLMLLCSNCHRMVHRRRPLLDAGTLRRITRP